MVAAGMSTVLWLPLIHAFSQYSAPETASPGYYAKPTAIKLIWAYTDSLATPASLLLMILAAMVAIALGKVHGVLPSRNEASEGDSADFWTLAIGAALLTLIVFVFGVLFTGTFNQRYSTAALIGISALVAGSFSDSPSFARAVPLIALAATIWTLSYTESYYGKFDQSAAFQKLPGPYPIVVAEGLQFFQLEESTPPQIRSRLTYLTLPSGIRASDPTNELMVRRWKRIDPNLPITDLSVFLGLHPRFYVIDTKSSDDTLASYLLGKGLIELTDQSGGVLLYKSRVPSAAGSW
jgi:hypothetical protein